MQRRYVTKKAFRVRASEFPEGKPPPGDNTRSRTTRCAAEENYDSEGNVYDTETDCVISGSSQCRHQLLKSRERLFAAYRATAISPVLAFVKPSSPSSPSSLAEARIFPGGCKSGTVNRVFADNAYKTPPTATMPRFLETGRRNGKFRGRG